MAQMTDSGFAAWSANFEALVAVNYASYGLTNGQATAYTTSNTAWQAAYAAAINPATRTPVTIAAKDTQRAATEALARQLAQIAKADPDTSDEDLVALGITVNKFPPTPVATPTSFPLLDFLAATPGQHRLQWRDSDTPTTRRKPVGAVAMELWGNVGTEPAPTPEGAVFLGDYSKTPFVVDLEIEDRGKTITYFGRWKTQTNLVGPWSDGVSFEIGW